MSQKIVLRSVVVLTVLALASLAMAQEPHHKMKMMKYGGSCIPDLTEEQDSQIKKLNLDLDKTVMPLKADLNVKKAELEKLLLADKPDKKAVHKKIDEIMAFKTQLKKKKVDNQLAVSALLTPDQQVAFHKHHSKCGMKHHGMGMMGEGGKKVVKIRKYMGKDAPMDLEEEVEIEEMDVE
ncbi:MAG: periplasmic heavy metal sensor [Syntrophaceae bacterium]|nr:periplasmic heavy metal sensor [Syntrophaceae bacterium]